MGNALCDQSSAFLDVYRKLKVHNIKKELHEIHIPVIIIEYVST